MFAVSHVSTWPRCENSQTGTVERQGATVWSEKVGCQSARPLAGERFPQPKWVGSSVRCSDFRIPILKASLEFCDPVACERSPALPRMAALLPQVGSECYALLVRRQFRQHQCAHC